MIAQRLFALALALAVAAPTLPASAQTPAPTPTPESRGQLNADVPSLVFTNLQHKVTGDAIGSALLRVLNSAALLGDGNHFTGAPNVFDAPPTFGAPLGAASGGTGTTNLDWIARADGSNIQALSGLTTAIFSAPA